MPGPAAAPIETRFRETLARGQIELPGCEDCGRIHFYPRNLCPHCHSANIALRPVSGRGRVHSTTTVRRRAERGGDYNLCIVELEEGVRMMSRVEGLPPERVRIGLLVRLFVGEIDAAPAILCQPAEARA